MMTNHGQALSSQYGAIGQASSSQYGANGQASSSSAQDGGTEETKIHFSTIHGSKETLDIVEKLGQGAFGVVYKAIDKRGKPFAVKKIECSDLKVQDTVGQELNALLRLRHEFIVRMYAYDFEGISAILIMEYCPRGNLNQRLMYDVEETQRFHWMNQLIEALLYLHSNHIVHRDLKPENVLLNEHEDMKLGDFGIARDFRCDGQDDPTRKISEYLDSYMNHFAGTPFWVAPEVFCHKYTEKADIFSLGVIFYAILTRDYCDYGGTSYYGAFVRHRGKKVGIGQAMSEKHSALYLTDFPEPTETNGPVIDVIKRMVHYDAEQRIPLQTVLAVITEAYTSLVSPPSNSFLKKLWTSESTIVSSFANETLCCLSGVLCCKNPPRMQSSEETENLLKD